MFYYIENWFIQIFKRMILQQFAAIWSLVGDLAQDAKGIITQG